MAEQAEKDNVDRPLGSEAQTTQNSIDGEPPGIGDVEENSNAKVSDWDSDPENPRNWPMWKRVFHTAIPALYGFVVTLGTSAYVPAIPLVMEKFHVSREVAILPLSLYTAGFCIGPLIAAPMSELYGRRIVYWTTLPLLAVFLSIAGSTDHIGVLIAFRLLASIGGSGSLAVGAGTIADLWDRQTHGGRAAIFYILAPFLGPALGPLTGAYIISEYHNDWRYSMWVVLIIAAPIGLCACFMKETSKMRILYLRNKRQGIKQVHKSGDTRILLQKLRVAIIRPMHMLLVEPALAFLSIYTGFAFAMMFSFFGSYSYVFQSVYGFNQKEVGLTFLGILIGLFLAIVFFVLFDATLYTKATIKARTENPNGKPDPEHRLYAAMIGSFALPIGLFWFAWAPAKDVHWIIAVLAGVPFGCGCLSIFVSVTTYLVDIYDAATGASAVAANGIMRYALGAAFPLFTLQMYDAIGIHWAGSVFAFISVAMLPLPWVFFYKGAALRSKSRYVTNEEN